MTPQPVSIRHVPVREGEVFLLDDDTEFLVSVEWAPPIFHVIVMRQEGAQGEEGDGA